MIIPSVTSILKTHADFSRVSDNILYQAIARGDMVHSWCASVAKNKMLGNTLWYPPLPTYLAGYGESFLYFMDMVEEVLLVEEELADFNIGFVGHPDIVARLSGHEHPGVYDLKTPTTKNRLWKFQISAYAYLVSKYLNTRIEHSGALRLRSDGGTPKFDEVEDPDECFAAFLLELQFQKKLWE